MFYNVIGSVTWVAAMMLGGHYLEKLVLKEWGFSLKDHIEAITIGIILVTTLPVLYKLFVTARKKPIDENPPPNP
ncbi:MAG TPA: hypothetical protein VLJ68_04555 [Chitinophagaceae bacterium]|nr:hypothetical protein [Chitinophagaceae bacterium]